MTTGQSPQPKDEQDVLNDLLKQELDKWSRLGMTPASIKTEALYDTVRIDVMGQALIDKGILNEEEVNIAVKKRMLETLQHVRETHEEALRTNIVTPKVVLPNNWKH